MARPPMTRRKQDKEMMIGRRFTTRGGGFTLGDTRYVGCTQLLLLLLGCFFVVGDDRQAEMGAITSSLIVCGVADEEKELGESMWISHRLVFCREVDEKTSKRRLSGRFLVVENEAKNRCAPIMCAQLGDHDDSI